MVILLYVIVIFLLDYSSSLCVCVCNMWLRVERGLVPVEQALSHSVTPPAQEFSWLIHCENSMQMPLKICCLNKKHTAVLEGLERIMRLIQSCTMYGDPVQKRKPTGVPCMGQCSALRILPDRATSPEHISSDLMGPLLPSPS